MYDLYELLLDVFPAILNGSINTIIIVFVALGVGFLLGLPMAIFYVYGPKWLSPFIRLYVWFFRGTPVLILLYLFYFGLFSLFELNLSNLASSCLVLGFTSAAYQSQIFRGSLLSISVGQLKAARALGMSDFQSIKSIILPQALRISIPSWTNEYSILLKDSAVAFALGTPEIMAKTHAIASRTQEHLPIYILAGVVYFIITLIGVALLRRLEHMSSYACWLLLCILLLLWAGLVVYVIWDINLVILAKDIFLTLLRFN
ncbi:amino acid ABC transporter permease [Desulfovibrio litoralis]|uniref:Amino acid ABC transporter membrane protein 1, PAAT family (TC 3.A.1.3.-) n=1 Tax=Desulfovibrio litoralis DSM 11393 TaxID=1121455 RepID=A0A1M7SA77_9BACT|nr:amino acid ABC transporter permease [Desulfovibrio litoralis]SHN55370.1 amino acid ABC transporter membrane protein 1, PAAT family (TC 3.A.1.3.-) [Desulfovibrio litoralis DSM 11393]